MKACESLKCSSPLGAAFVYGIAYFHFLCYRMNTWFVLQPNLSVKSAPVSNSGNKMINTSCVSV